MNQDQGVEESRKDKNMRGIEAPERPASDLLPALEYSPEIITDQGGGASNVGSDRSGPVRLLVPGEQVAGKAEKHDQKKQDHTHHPGKLPRVLVSSHEEDSKKMDKNHHHVETCAPVVEPPVKAPELD